MKNLRHVDYLQGSQVMKSFQTSRYIRPQYLFVSLKSHNIKLTPIFWSVAYYLKELLQSTSFIPVYLR